MSKVFISYSREDGDFAELVRGRLRDAGFETWIDLEGLDAGEDWRHEIDEAIWDSAALVLVLTPAASRSVYVAYEWAFALGSRVTVIPTLWQATNPHPRLAVLQHLDFTRREMRPWPKLVEAIEQAASARQAHSIRLAHNAPGIVAEAVAGLDDPDPDVMGRSVQRLSEMKLPEAEAALVGALNHPLPEVRIRAAWVLMGRGDIRALPGLVEATRRSECLFSKQYEKMASVSPGAVIGLLDDGEAWVRSNVLYALAQTGGAGAVEAAMRCVKDPDHRVREAAAFALNRLGTPESLAALDEAIRALTGDVDDNSKWPGNVDLRSRLILTRQFLESLNQEKAKAAAGELERRAQALESSGAAG